MNARCRNADDAVATSPSGRLMGAVTLDRDELGQCFGVFAVVDEACRGPTMWGVSPTLTAQGCPNDSDKSVKTHT